MHLGKVILMLALAASFVHLGALLRLDDTSKSPSRERGDGDRSSRWRALWIGGLAGGAGLLTGFGVGEAVLLAAAVGAAVARQSSAG